MWPLRTDYFVGVPRGQSHLLPLLLLSGKTGSTAYKLTATVLCLVDHEAACAAGPQASYNRPSDPAFSRRERALY